MQSEDLTRDDLQRSEAVGRCLQRSSELASEGRLEEAVEVIRGQISRGPDHPVLNLSLGMLLADIGDYEGAYEALKRELEITPRLRDAAWRLGSTCSQLGLAVESIEAYELALDVDPCCVPALYGLGNASRRNNDYRGAIEYYEDAIFLYPELDRSDPFLSDLDVKKMAVNIYYNLAVMHMILREMEKAKELFKRVLSLWPTGQLAELADNYLDLLSQDGALDSIEWSFYELPSQEA